MTSDEWIISKTVICILVHTPQPYFVNIEISVTRMSCDCIVLITTNDITGPKII